MSKLVTTMILVAFAASIGLGSFQPADASDYVTFCVKMKKNGDPKKNSKPKRAADGKDPGSPCKSKEKEFTVPTDTITDDLQSQIDALDDQINGMDGIADMVQMNKDDISTLQSDVAEIKAGLISSMIGGGHRNGDDGAATFWMPLFDFFRENSAEENIAAKVAVTGWLTKLAVIVNEPVGAMAKQDFRLVVDGTPSPLDTACEIEGDSATMCEATGCVEIDMGETLSVQVQAINEGNPPNVSATRWTARFVETEADCPTP